MARSKFHRAIQSRAARAAIGPSSVRGQVPGVAKAAREFLGDLNLRPFGTRDAARFKRALNRATNRLEKALPRKSRSWGLSRKLLNIFLRDCLYTVYLRREVKLNYAERFFELPLDSVTGTELRSRCEGLPAWPGVKYLKRELSECYQKAASEIADDEGLVRVHLDAYFWSLSRDDRE